MNEYLYPGFIALLSMDKILFYLQNCLEMSQCQFRLLTTDIAKYNWECSKECCFLSDCKSDLLEHLRYLGIGLTEDKTVPENEQKLLAARAGLFGMTELSAKLLVICSNCRLHLGIGWLQNRGKNCQFPLHSTLGKKNNTASKGIDMIHTRHLFEKKGIFVPFGTAVCKHCFRWAEDSLSELLSIDQEQQATVPKMYPELATFAVVETVSEIPQQIKSSNLHDQTEIPSILQVPRAQGIKRVKVDESQADKETASASASKDEGNVSSDSDDPEERKRQTTQKKPIDLADNSETSPPICCLIDCDKAVGVKTKRQVKWMDGVWLLKPECKNMSPTKILVCESCYKFQGNVMKHPNVLKTKKKFKEVLQSEVNAPELTCFCGACKRKGRPMIVARGDRETACPFHMVCLETPTGTVEFYTVCKSFTPHLSYQNTLRALPSFQRRVFVCPDCMPQFLYLATQFLTDLSNIDQPIIAEFEQLETTVVSSPLTKSVGQKVRDFLTVSPDKRCEGYTNEYLLRHYMNSLLVAVGNGNEITDPNLIFLRLSNAKMHLFSVKCTGLKEAKRKHNQCDPCYELWRGVLRHRAKRQKKAEQKDPAAQTKISTMSPEQLRNELVRARNTSRQLKADHAKLNSLLQIMKEKTIEAPPTMKLTAARLELLVDHALRSGTINKQSLGYMLLLSTCSNLRRNDKRSKGYRYSKETLTIATWLAAKCRRSGYEVAAMLVPGLPCWRTVEYFKNRFMPDDETEAQMNRRTITAFLEFMKEKRDVWVGGIHFDEMGINSGLVVSARSGECVGFGQTVDLAELDREYEELFTKKDFTEASTQDQKDIPQKDFPVVDEQIDELAEEQKDEEPEAEEPTTEVIEPSEQQEHGDDDDSAYGRAVTRSDLSTQLLVFFWSSITGELSFPVASFGIAKMTASIIGDRISFVIKTMDILAAKANVKLHTMYFTSDGATYTDSYVRQNSQSGHWVPYPGREGYQWLIALSDPPHLMKKLRNGLLDQTRTLTDIRAIDKLYTKRLWKKTADIADDELYDEDLAPNEGAADEYRKKKDRDRQDLYNLPLSQQTTITLDDRGSPVHYNRRFHYKEGELEKLLQQHPPAVTYRESVLTGRAKTVEFPLHSRYYLSRLALSGCSALKPSHIELTAKTKMNVKKAVNVCSEETAEAIWKVYIEDYSWLEDDTQEAKQKPPLIFPGPLCDFIRHADRFFRVMNSTILPTEIVEFPIYWHGETRIITMKKWKHDLLSCLCYFRRWKNELEKAKIDLKRHFITIPTFRHLLRTIHGAIALFELIQEQFKDNEEIVINPRSTNQDDVENIFSLHRQRIAGSAPTQQQVTQQHGTLSFLYQLRQRYDFRSEIGSYGTATFEGPVPSTLLAEPPPKRAQQPLTDELEDIPDYVNPSPEHFQQMTLPNSKENSTHVYNFRRYLQTSLSMAKRSIPNGNPLPDDLPFLKAVDSHRGFEILLKHFTLLGLYCRQHIFKEKQFSTKLNLRALVPHFIESIEFQNAFWHTELKTKLEFEILPGPPFQQRLLFHFMYRLFVYFISVDNLNPYDSRRGRNQWLRTRLAIGAVNSASREQRALFDDCGKCGQSGHWGVDCPFPAAAGHLQTIRCDSCNAIGHLSNNCTEKIAKPYRTYTTANLQQVVNRMPVSDIKKFLGSIFQQAAQQAKPAAVSEAMGADLAKYALLPKTLGKTTVSQRTKELHTAYYRFLRNGKEDLLNKLVDDDNGITSSSFGAITAEDATAWRSLNTSSAMLTLLENLSDVLQSLKIPKSTQQHYVDEIGWLPVSGNLWSTPGLLFHGQDKIAIHTVARLQHGRPKPLEGLPLGEHIEILLKMAALSSDHGMLISWSPIGTTIFHLTRALDFEKRLIKHLTTFVTNAKDRQPQDDSAMLREAEALADLLTPTDDKHKPKPIKPVCSVLSAISEVSKNSTIQMEIVLKCDEAKAEAKQRRKEKHAHLTV